MKQMWIMLVVLLLSACNPNSVPAAKSDKVVVFVSILPQKYLVQQIGSPEIAVEVLVPPGGSPATYTTTPKQLMQLGRSQVLFYSGVPFEKVLLPKLKKTSPILLSNINEGIELVEGQCAHDHGDHSHHHDLDPHTWLDPILMKAQAQNVCQQLSKLMPEKKQLFEQRLKQLQEDLSKLDEDIRNTLQPLKNRSFFVYHPAYSYFALRYDLEQVPIEQSGKEPGAKYMSSVLKLAKEKNVRAIFVQPQFKGQSAAKIAEQLGCQLVTLDPLSDNYLDNLKEMATKMVKAMQTE